MYYFITASKDSYITENQPTAVVQFRDTVTKNYGGDEILELKKGFFNSYDTSSFNVSRVLVKFDYTNISESITNGEITNPQYFLRLYEVEGQTELNNTYTIEGFPLSQSFEEGVGKRFDNPQVEKGVTWTDSNSGSAWSKPTGINSFSGSRTKSLGGGVWMTGSGYEASQSFTNQSGDIEMDVTDIVEKHLGGGSQITNNGFLLKLTDTIESNSTPHDLKFFSKQTNTIYQPKLEVRWNDIKYPNALTGLSSLTYITMSGELKNHIFIKGLQKSYKESERIRFRLGCRKKYVTKTFTESVLTSSFHIPKGSGSYSIIDVGTNTTVVPFDTYTSMSADTTSMYIDQWFDNFEPGRYYKFLFKLKYTDGSEQIIDNNEEFKII